MSNVFRQAGFLVAATVLLLDMGRSMLVALISLKMLPLNWVPWVGLALILGNRYPCFHGFRGGKGVANYLGFTLLISPLSSLIAAISWFLSLACFQIPFIGSFVMVAILAGGTVFACSYHPLATAGALLTAAFIFFGHRQNVMSWINRK